MCDYPFHDVKPWITERRERAPLLLAAMAPLEKISFPIFHENTYAFTCFVPYMHLKRLKIQTRCPKRGLFFLTSSDHSLKIGSQRKTFFESSSLWSSIRSRSLTTKLDGGRVENQIAIDVEDLCLNICSEKGKIPILKSCSMKIPKGEFWMLLGPNGCGKSTILKALAGILRPNRGNVLVQGPRSFVFQNPDHQVVMPTAEADVAFGLGCLNLPEDEVKERVFNSLEVVAMAAYAQRPIQTLSGGQKQRIAIAGALAEASQVLLLDELTTFLDEYDQRSVLEAVRRAVRGSDSVTALWVTHRLEELEYADGAVYMEDGKIILSGNVGKVSRYIERQKRKAEAR